MSKTPLCPFRAAHFMQPSMPVSLPPGFANPVDSTTTQQHPILLENRVEDAEKAVVGWKQAYAEATNAWYEAIDERDELAEQVHKLVEQVAELQEQVNELNGREPSMKRHRGCVERADTQNHSSTHYTGTLL